MKIRRAKPEDAKQIRELALSLKLDLKNPSSKGYLYYIQTKKEYENRIKKSNYFYVAEKNKKIIGFLMCYDDRTFRKLGKNLSYKDATSKILLKQKTPYMFGDQIGISYKKGNQGIGKALMKQLMLDMKKNKIKRMYVEIFHKPKNKPSINFCKKLGFKFIAEAKNKDGSVWGIYGLDKGLKAGDELEIKVGTKKIEIRKK